MDLSGAIKHIIDGEAIIIMGAGASCGATNAFGEYPSASKLSEHLYELCSIVPDDKNDLQDAAQTYEEFYSAAELIRKIKEILTCTSFQPCHSVIYSQPWIRYYTTNYDDVALLAAKEKGIDIIPVTLNMDYSHYCNKKHLCVHINGHINNLTEDTLHTEFKLTTTSYISAENISNSPWGALLTDDLEAAKCIVILGLSLNYDLDLSRILFGSDIKNKTIIIDKPDLTQNSENKLSRFGTVFKIGLFDFAKRIEEVAASYTPRTIEPIDRIYNCFKHDNYSASLIPKAVPSDVFQLFFAGKYTDALFHKSNGKYDSFIYRSCFAKLMKMISEGKRYIFLHADMGNGKTACIHELRNRLSKRGFHVFTLVNDNVTTLSDEILAICSIEYPVIVFIDNYTSYMDVVRIFSIRDHKNIQFVFAARSAVNYSKMPDVLSAFSVKENESAIVNVNKLNKYDIEHCIEVFDRYGAWGRNAGLCFEQKYSYLKRREHGNSRFQSIMVDILQSEDMSRRITQVVKAIQSESKSYHSAVIIILITQIMNLRISARDIEKITNQSVTSDPKFRTNPAIQELLVINDKQKTFYIKSPVTAKLILRKVADSEMIIAALNSLATYAVKYNCLPRYSTLLNDIISFSHISSFLMEYNNAKAFLAAYYDQLSTIEYYRNSNFFWLQYAISCIEVSDYSRAQKYLDNAYGLIPEGFVPFQINNQQARLYLEMIISGEATDSLDKYKKAHTLLMLPIVSDKDNEFNVVKLFGYYTRKDFKKRMTSTDLREFCKHSCSDAYNRIKAFVKKHPEYSHELNDLSKKLFNQSFDEIN